MNQTQTNQTQTNQTQMNQTQTNQTLQLPFVEPIYKTFLYDSTGNINKIIIFTPDTEEKDSSLSISEKIKPFFTPEEVEDIERNSITIIWSSLNIHQDDTIKTIKEKITYEIHKNPTLFPSPIQPSNLYLFALLNENIDLVNIYQSVTQNDKKPISKETFAQILSNFNIPPQQYENIEVKDFYDYDDFIKAFTTTTDGKTLVEVKNMATPLGFYFHQSIRDYTFVANPYTIINTSADRYSIETSKNLLKFNEDTILLNYGNLIGNNIYCCFYDDVINYSFKTTAINEEYITELYFPIFNEDESTYISMTKLKGTAIPDKWRTIDSFYDLYRKTNHTDLQKEKTSEFYKVPYISRGIQTIAFSVLSSGSQSQTLPLESIYKNLHASASIPFISFNPRFKKESILRLYTNRISKNGKKIPFLRENEIAKISKELNNPKTISFYIVLQENNQTKRRLIGDQPEEDGFNSILPTGVGKVDIYTELTETGEIRVRSTHPTMPLSVKEWNKIFRISLTPVLIELNKLLNQYGYPIFEFRGLETSNINIKNIKYTENIKLNKNISLTEINGLNEIFTIIGNKDTTNVKGGFKDDISKGIILRFKRVDNFKENDEQTILITELFKKTQDTDVILNVLKENFNMSEIDAKTRLTKFITEHKYELDDIRDCAGFPTIFQLNKQVSFNNTLIVTVDEINSLKYLDILHVYIDCILQISLNTTLDQSELFGKKGWVVQLKKATGFFAGQEVIEQAVKSTIKPITAIQFTDEEDELLSVSSVDDDKDKDEIDIEHEETNNIESETDDTNDSDFINMDSDDEEPINTESILKIKKNINRTLDENLETDQEQKPHSLEDIVLFDKDSKSKSMSQTSDDDLILLDENDSDSDSDNEKDNSHKITGGGLTDINLDGQPISFLERLQSREPSLFLSKKNGKYETYSRMCESNLKRQPVVLTAEEKEDIDKNHPGSYNESIEYGTGDNKYWYICPRYWCLKTNTSITEDEVKTGVCGGIIPKDATRIPKGFYVYEFNSGTKQHLDAKGNYINNVPGFLGADSHPDGKCIPCCFKGSWYKPQQRKRREECSQNITKQSNIENSENKEGDNLIMLPSVPPPTAKKGDVFYIFNSVSYPIQQHRFGFLPISIQKMFQMDVSKMVIRSNTANIKPDTPCLVRYGVENSNKQSFIACFAEIYSYKQELETPPTIAEMKQILCNTITIDDFVNYHNGSLISVFKEKPVTTPPSTTIAITIEEFTRFQTSRIWINTFNQKETELLTENKIADFVEGKLDDSDHDELFSKLTYIKMIILSYRGFLSYLKDPSIEIDHTFLWDAITDSKPELIKDGINLIILQIPNDDLTDNVEIICPTVSMSNKSYDFTNRETVILIKQEEFYEPIYLYEEKNKMIRVTKTFLEKSLIKPVIQTIQTIKTISKKYCASQPSRSKIYHFKRNREAEQIYDILKKNDYNIQLQLSNYQGKIIGFYVTHRTVKPTNPETLSAEGVYIPVYPSTKIQTPIIPVKFADEESDIYKNYETTLHRLRNIQKNTSGLVLVEPKLKVVEDGLVVGILTETNQFIQLSHPETLENTITIDGDTPIESISGSNYITADKTLNTVNSGDKDRENAITGISLESQFYIMFRSMFRILLTKYENAQIVSKIQHIIETPTMLYKEKLRDLIVILKQISEKTVEFKEMEAKTAQQIIKLKITPELMGLTTDGSLIIPKFNLINNYDNELLYYAKIADEILRYTRIRLFLFQPKYFLSIPNQQYSINNDEFLVLRSLLTHDYFKDIRPFNVAPQIHNTEYSYAEPAIKDPYSNKFTQKEIEAINNGNEGEQDEDEQYCINSIRSVSGAWSREFSLNPRTKEIGFKNTVICSYSPIIYILQRRVEGKGEITVQLIRKILWIGYSKYMKTYEKQILYILKKEGKSDFVDKIAKGRVSLETLIYSEDYYLTNLDFWIISIEVQLPIILFNSTTLKNMVEGVDWLFLGGGNIHDYIYYIRSPALIEKNEPPRFSIITPSFKYTQLKEMKDRIQEIISNTGNYKNNTIELTDFLRDTIIPTVTRKFVIKPSTTTTTTTTVV